MKVSELKGEKLDYWVGIRVMKDYIKPYQRTGENPLRYFARRFKPMATWSRLPIFIVKQAD